MLRNKFDERAARARPARKSAERERDRERVGGWGVGWKHPTEQKGWASKYRKKPEKRKKKTSLFFCTNMLGAKGTCFPALTNLIHLFNRRQEL